MAIIKYFEIKNFKGIEYLKIDINDKFNSPVLTLIGLNESGKTTILEAISHFVSGDKSISSLFEPDNQKNAATQLIPIHKKAAFTAKTTITATVQLEEKDIEAIEEYIRSQKTQVNTEELKKEFTITKSYSFEDSEHKKTNQFYGFNLQTRATSKSVFKKYVQPSLATVDKPNLWQKVVRIIDNGLPQIAYFPTFLVNMPAKIYLEEFDDESAVNLNYRFVFQDILDTLEDNLSLEKHVCSRIRQFKASEKNTSWLSLLLGSTAKAPIDSVFQKISNTVTKEVLGSWQRVFQRTINAKSIHIEWNIDTENDDLPYASFYVFDGESKYAINERSLGFRWFFSFLLFTAFKQKKSRKTIFLFDEPAANLHAKAQAELLTSFKRIASNGNKIIYSTHSHHMIDPQWLNGAYIIENTALDYDADDNFILSTKPTSIIATTYRQFASHHPSRSSYFQPVTEKLEYVPPAIFANAPLIVVEGISDFYAIKLAARLLEKRLNFYILPCTGSGSAGPIISQCLGRGENFKILLDDDKAGIKESARYKENWLLSDKDVITIGEITPDFKGMSLEKLLGEGQNDLIQKYLNLDSHPTKKQVGWYLAEIYSHNNVQRESMTESALANLDKIIEYFNSNLGFTSDSINSP